MPFNCEVVEKHRGSTDTIVSYRITHHSGKNKKKFLRGKMVLNDEPPALLSGEEILAEIESLGLMKVTETGVDSVNGRIAKTLGWRKRSIFWDSPYWKTNLIRNNLDVMLIEKNVFDNIFNTIMSVPTKSKDNAKARQDIHQYCL
ncbi:hypothetical protein Syun_019174 [Stephania yunnanensis]|uniref:Uncharacterized protein n=1 Tax=Stephania yunnanensis TaxID=152371 RepID=A0AAP0ITL7_9MAGN